MTSSVKVENHLTWWVRAGNLDKKFVTGFEKAFLIIKTLVLELSGWLLQARALNMDIPGAFPIQRSDQSSTGEIAGNTEFELRGIVEWRY